jgi:hypothetical protein
VLFIPSCRLLTDRGAPSPSSAETPARRNS